MSGEQTNIPDLAAFAGVLEAAMDGIVVVDDARRYLFLNPAACRLLGYRREELIGRDFLINFPPGEQRRMLEHFTANMAGRSGQWTSSILRPDGTEHEISYTNMQVRVNGRRCAAAIFREMTAENLRLARERGALIKIASSAAGASTLDTTLNTLAANVVRATGAVACSVMLTDGGPQDLRIAGTYGVPPGYGAAFNRAIREGLISPSVQAARERQPIILRDARRFILAQAAGSPLHEFVRVATWDIIISVPLIYRRNDVGVLTSYYAPAAFPGETEIPFLTAIADQAAVAVENARLLLEAQGKAILAERQRLARELHDSVSQALFGIVLGARTARALLAQDPSRAAEPIDYVLSLADAGLAEMRALLFELRPESLQTEGLVAALSKQAAAMRARYQIAVEATFCAEPEIPLELKEALYRISQEALHNIVKHARADQVDLRLACGPHGVVLDVGDNGQGFDPTAGYPGHLGLRSMRERAGHLGGTLTITSAPGAGSHLRAVIPIPGPPARDDG